MTPQYYLDDIVLRVIIRREGMVRRVRTHLFFGKRTPFFGKRNPLFAKKNQNNPHTGIY